MPIYVYKCLTCSHHFEKLLRNYYDNNRSTVRCERCRSDTVERLHSLLKNTGNLQQTSDSMHIPIAQVGIRKEEAHDISSLWRILDPPDNKDFVQHIEVNSLSVKSGWSIIGASLRGKYHAHEGRFREDAFAFDSASGWHFAAVADGAGSASLSRIGSQIASRSAVSFLKETLTKRTPGEEHLVEKDLIDAFRNASVEVQSAANIRQKPPRELATTLLILIHRPTDHGHIVVTGQIGDGSIVAWSPTAGVQELNRPDIGDFAGQTLFLTHNSVSFERRVRIEKIPNDTQLFLMMTDGIADDFFPSITELPRLLKPLGTILEGDINDRGSKLIQLIEYPRRGSFDDRTLVLVCSTGAGEKLKEWMHN